MTYRPLGDSLRYGAIGLAACAAFSAVVVIWAFDWSPIRVLLGGSLGLLVWGAVQSAFDLCNRLPSGALLEAPAHAVIESRPRLLSRSSAGTLLIVAALCAVAAWYVDLVDLGAVFVPGQFAGYAAAEALGLVLVRRWEREHGRLVLEEVTDGPDVTLVAAPLRRTLVS